MITPYGFQERLVMSDGAANGDVADVLLKCIPGAQNVTRSSEAEDRNGTDYWVALRSGHSLSVDVKVREVDPIVTWGSDDLLIEWTSAVETATPGWTVDPRKRTDYVCYWFVPTRRYALLPFPLLHAAATEARDVWQEQFSVRRSRSQQGSRRWTTEFSTVPRSVVWRAIYEIANGRAAA